MLAIAAILVVSAMVAFALNQSVTGLVLVAVAFGFVFSGVSEIFKERKSYGPVISNPVKNNIFFGNPMVDDILRMIEDTGCCELISFEPETSMRCKRRRFGVDDKDEVYYEFKMGERKVSLTLEEQYDLLSLLKYYLPNGESYQIQAAYDRDEYEALQKNARMDRFYADGSRVPTYVGEILPAQPKYYIMVTAAYRGMRFNKERRRWERPISVYSSASNEKAV